MNILYIILKKKEEKSSNITIESIKSNLKKDETFLEIELTNKEFDEQLYFKLKDNIDKKLLKKCDFISLILNDSFYEENFREIIEDYIDKNFKNKIYLPLSALISKDSVRGLLNTCVWSNESFEVGVLDQELALRQTDTILYGALIPKDLLLNESFYNKELKYYQHFYFLNKITSDSNFEVLGIPKLLVNIDFDLSYADLSKEEKTKYYKLAREIKSEEVINE